MDECYTVFRKNDAQGYDILLNYDSFGASLGRALSPLIVLCVLSERPMYMREIMQRIKMPNDGEFPLNALSPVVHRLTERGLLAVDRDEIVGGRVRRYYKVTGNGRECLDGTIEEYAALSGTVDLIIASYLDNLAGEDV